MPGDPWASLPWSAADQDSTTPSFRQTGAISSRLVTVVAVYIHRWYCGTQCSKSKPRPTETLFYIQYLLARMQLCNCYHSVAFSSNNTNVIAAIGDVLSSNGVTFTRIWIPSLTEQAVMIPLTSWLRVRHRVICRAVLNLQLGNARPSFKSIAIKNRYRVCSATWRFSFTQICSKRPASNVPVPSLPRRAYAVLIPMPTGH